MELQTKLSTKFPSFAYSNSHEQMRNMLFLPESRLKSANIREFEYVNVFADCSQSEEIGAEIPVASLPAVVNDRKAGVRTNLLAEIDPNLEIGDSICITESDRDSKRPLEVKRSFADKRVGRRCYLHQNLFTEFGLEEGGLVEVFSIEDGGRSTLPAWKSLVADEDEDVISIDGHTRKVLDIEVGDEVGVREQRRSSSRGNILDWILTPMVNYRQTTLRVLPGLDRDEHRNIARINNDMMNFLGIEPGDKVRIDWFGRTATVQCLLPPSGEGVPPLSIRLPSTERDRVSVSLYDSLEIQRDMAYVFKKQVALSTLGVLGVIISTLSILNYTDTSGLEAALGPEISILLFVLSLFAISLVVVWVLFYPIRQECKYHGGR